MNILVNLAFECFIQLTRLLNWKRRDGLYVALCGGPGAGKGTIASRLGPRSGIPHLNMGNILRREISENTEIGQRWGPWVKAGKLLPDKVVFKLLRAELLKPEYAGGAVLDGFPRTLAQARKLRWLLAWWGNKVDVVIFLEVTREDLIERLSLRRTCSNTKCGRTFHLKLNPPKVENTCDHCEAALYQRDDERPEAIETRMSEFGRNFQPVRDYYKSQGIFVVIRSSNQMSIEDVLEEVVFTVDEVD